ncbi:purine nucleoside phosphorylase I, inosine and guanosine-specific [Paracoccidioides brasiliensis Pb18]|uniref:Purine nucleoside phosphorylase n=2 Tax=Paracoccidioides brasiliensis TaxID=121759 RepID=C1GLD0_PARBD|nr:purine nucleoside phosphorylase I, inosine and guanosine-specific [Paracoccidioides brasiliensis Pb18]EEH43246.2 purine nucleoside phosphorylase I, inosine and guanosine-specific [Paracoccidioides brasiliensis Pb18]ODH13647.1 purine nucleoside phosphorylase I, inosine and guanosine-specific [Paracoccidioides brasiliensis]
MGEKSIFQQAQETCSYLRERLPAELQKPRFAIICGSGLGGLAESVNKSPKAEFDYASIPHFPVSTVPGHVGKLVFGILGENIAGVMMVGRSHYYEGHSVDRITFPVRLFKLLGIEIIVVTSAAGGLNPEYEVGDIVILNDHIFLAGLAGIHPLRGANDNEFGVRFPPLSDAYDLGLRRNAHRAWRKVTVPENTRRVYEGVYAFAGGPSFETRAECRLLRQLGADLVGMSTVPEIIVARHCGIRVLAMSLVTNKAVLTPVPCGEDQLLQNLTVDELNTIVEEGKANHEEVLEAGLLAAADMQKLVTQALADIFAAAEN